MTLSSVDIVQNRAVGSNGVNGTIGGGGIQHSGNGTNGSNGTPGLGGGIFNGAGSLTISNSAISANQAIGGDGGLGGGGGFGQGATRTAGDGQSALGGNGGIGGVGTAVFGGAFTTRRVQASRSLVRRSEETRRRAARAARVDSVDSGSAAMPAMIPRWHPETAAPPLGETGEQEARADLPTEAAFSTSAKSRSMAIPPHSRSTSPRGAPEARAAWAGMASAG